MTKKTRQEKNNSRINRLCNINIFYKTISTIGIFGLCIFMLVNLVEEYMNVGLINLSIVLSIVLIIINMRFINALVDGINYLNAGIIDYIEFKKGKDGVHKEWYENEQLKEEWNYKNNKEDGLCRGWWKNGNLKFKYFYVLGVENGEWKEWNINGKLVVEEIYTNGELVSNREYENDKLLTTAKQSWSQKDNTKIKGQEDKDQSNSNW